MASDSRLPVPLLIMEQGSLSAVVRKGASLKRWKCWVKTQWGKRWMLPLQVRWMSFLSLRAGKLEILRVCIMLLELSLIHI